ncbi:semaphorin-7A [Chanos chanos]|uniref:Semaphorin-7A n=1 Tax=Chanos chanos TaxID=29144 RepID=A0A6J2WYZ3_CHACN|nr:semaphorin-7A-like [Chanos chanos]
MVPDCPALFPVYTSWQPADGGRRPIAQCSLERVRPGGCDLTLPRYTAHSNGLMKLVRDPQRTVIYAGGVQDLFIIKPDSNGNEVKPMGLSMFEDECKQESNSDCRYNISLLREGEDGFPLYICGTMPGKLKCCSLSSNSSLVNCWKRSSDVTRLNINEPSVQIGGALYFTVSAKSDGGVNTATTGLYRFGEDMDIWPQGGQKEQRYVKVVASRGREEPLQDKVYTFYTEKNLDGKAPAWIPRVSQFCVADKGGTKAHLQFRWTSMLTGTLACGERDQGRYFTELIDVAVIEAKHWSETKIYALFRNDWGMSGVCVYTMADIDVAFRTSSFKRPEENDTPSRLGECVKDSQQLSAQDLMLMAKQPELEEWIKGENASHPLLVSHRRYTHIQVDRVGDNAQHTVLLLALESGGIHKILAGNGQAFIIAEFDTFPHGTRIQSMVLGSSEKRLYVSSHTEVHQINLSSCSLYGHDCEGCVQARDPYCGWDGHQCTEATRHTRQDVVNGSATVCQNEPKGEHLSGERVWHVDPSSQVFLVCPAISRHARYTWIHHDAEKACVPAGQQCVRLIDSMSEENEGAYKCRVTENGASRVLAQYHLKLNSGVSQGKSALLTLACAMLLLSVIY